jgi:Uma2 family endonuclease
MRARKTTTRERRAPEPAVDERLVMPETRYEIIGGEVVYVTPADPPHATRHSKVSAVVEAYASPEYEVASDMLTRTSEKGDMAPDVSVFPRAPDPVTGGRQLERLAFEVVSTETLPAAARKAASLAERGVARIFALDANRRRALEWSRRTNGWEILPHDAVIEDRALVAPLPVHDLVKAAKADDAMARGLLAKRNRVLLRALGAARIEGKIEGKIEGAAEAILTVLAGRGLRVSAAQEALVRSTGDAPTLRRWLLRAGACRTTTELLRDPPSQPGKPRRRKVR